MYGFAAGLDGTLHSPQLIQMHDLNIVKIEKLLQQLSLTCSVLYPAGISTAMLSGIGAAVGVMVLMTGSALFYRSAMGGKKD